MEGTFIELFGNMVSRYGLLMSLLLIGIVISVSFNCNQAIRAVVGFIRHRFGRLAGMQVDLSKSIFFSEMKYMIDRLNDINCSCVLRRKLYHDIMKERLVCINDAIEEFIKRDFMALPPKELAIEMMQCLDEANRVAAQRMIDNQVPEFIIKAMQEEIDIEWKFEKKRVRVLCDSEYSHEDNSTRISSVMQMIITGMKMQCALLEDALASFNGDIKKLNYHGIECMDCKLCVHDQYLKEQRRKD